VSNRKLQQVGIFLLTLTIFLSKLITDWEKEHFIVFCPHGGRDVGCSFRMDADKARKSETLQLPVS